MCRPSYKHERRSPKALRLKERCYYPSYRFLWFPQLWALRWVSIQHHTAFEPRCEHWGVHGDGGPTALKARVAGGQGTVGLPCVGCCGVVTSPSPQNLSPRRQAWEGSGFSLIVVILSRECQLSSKRRHVSQNILESTGFFSIQCCKRSHSDKQKNLLKPQFVL